jgi:S-DNA-T family DNA segregation ATPase FtsK/SpoIIIE
MQGAEKLVGKGDMLFNPMGMGKPIRVQGTFVSDGEVNDVIQFVKSQVEGGSTNYNADVLTRIERSNTSDAADETDDLLPEAIDLVVRSGQASVSMLQRRFRIGYNRAARIVDMMEARGIIGPQDGSRPRQVLMTEAELEAMENDTADL